MGLLEIQVKGSEDLRRMARALREADQVGLRRGLSRTMRQAARPAFDALRQSARDISTRGERKPGARHPFVGPTVPKGTRAKIAEACVLDVRVDEENPRVRFRVAAAKLPAGLQGMPRKFDGQHWRHPVMGNREVWVGQSSQPWFFPPIRDHLRDFRAQIDQALEETRAKLEAS